MDFESPDVEKDFPGLYASETGRKSNESDFSDGGEHEKSGKKDLLGRRKDKKEKKDRGYAALEGESSPEEDTDTKSPSKSKKTKSFKFPTKSKEKREKSRDKEKVTEDVVKQKDVHDKKKEKEREKEKKEKEKREKLREKDKEKEEKAKFKLESKEKLKDEKKDKVKDKDKDKCKEKEKEKEKVRDKEKDKGKEKEKDKVKEKEKDKGKEKEKDKKDKHKLTKVPSTVTSGVPFEEIFTLGVALPIFGVPLCQSVERSRCHDDTGLPLVVRDSIDYLQAYGLKSPLIYRSEADKIKLQQLRKLYTDRGTTYPYHWDVAVACAILKAFISELPSPILAEQRAQAEAASVLAEPQRALSLTALLLRLPTANRTLLAWLVVHFHHVVAHENVNHVSVEYLATVMGPALNMSHTLLKYLISNADTLFPDTELSRYVPPLPCMPTSLSAPELALELRKQESLLAQIHAELHAGFSTPARDQQLWEAQRIVTQLKRKLRSVQKSVEPTPQPSQQPSIDEKQPEEPTEPPVQTIDKLPQTIDKLPQTIDKLPQTTDKLPQTIDKLPQTIDKLPLTIDKPPQTINKLHQIIDKPPQIKEESKSPIIPPPIEPRLSLTPDINIRESPKLLEKTFSDDAFEDNFDFSTTTDLVLTPPIEPKPKLSEKELKLLRLQLENAEYLQLKSLLQAKINSEQFEIVKLRSHVALKNKQELNNAVVKENKMDAAEEIELKQKLVKENVALDQKVSNLCNQIFQERVACIQLKIDLAMKEIL